jgi:hypothetical protein
MEIKKQAHDSEGGDDNADGKGDVFERRDKRHNPIAK